MFSQPPDLRRSKLLLAFALGFAALHLGGTTAIAQERSCGANYVFTWGQNVQGTFSTRAGTPCVVHVVARLSSTISSMRVVRGPGHGSASSAGPVSLRYVPKAGFTGRDSMIVGFTGTGSAGKPRTATVTFVITVH
jgi:hypothetical protein